MKTPPMLIFKGIYENHLENKLNKIKVVLEKKYMLLVSLMPR